MATRHAYNNIMRAMFRMADEPSTWFSVNRISCCCCRRRRNRNSRSIRTMVTLERDGTDSEHKYTATQTFHSKREKCALHGKTGEENDCGYARTRSAVKRTYPWVARSAERGRGGGSVKEYLRQRQFNTAPSAAAAGCYEQLFSQ